MVVTARHFPHSVIFSCRIPKSSPTALVSSAGRSATTPDNTAAMSAKGTELGTPSIKWLVIQIHEILNRPGLI